MGGGYMVRIVAFTGNAGAGKSTAMNIVRSNIRTGGELKRFAEPLYKLQNHIYYLVELNKNKNKDSKNK